MTALSLYYLGLFVMPFMAVVMAFAAIHPLMRGAVTGADGRLLRRGEQPVAFFGRVLSFAACSLFALGFFLFALVKGSDGFV